MDEGVWLRTCWSAMLRLANMQAHFWSKVQKPKATEWSGRDTTPWLGAACQWWLRHSDFPSRPERCLSTCEEAFHPLSLVICLSHLEPFWAFDNLDFLQSFGGPLVCLVQVGISVHQSVMSNNESWNNSLLAFGTTNLFVYLYWY